MEACLPCDKTGMTCQYWPHTGNISSSINDIIPSKRQHNAVLTEWLRHYVVITHLGIMLCKYDVTWASCRLNSWSNRSFIQKLVHVINKNLFMLSAKFALMVICVWNSTVKILYYNDVIIDGVSNHQPRDCLLKRLFRRRSKKTSKLRVTGLCVGNSPHKWPVTRKIVPFDDVIMFPHKGQYTCLCHDVLMYLPIFIPH